MVRLFHVYYPVRTLVLLGCEALIVCASFLIAALIRLGPDTYLVLNYENGFYKILLVTLLAMLCSYYLDLYAPSRLNSRDEIYFRLLLVLGVLCLLLAALGYFVPDFMFGRNIFVLGMGILAAALLAWRSAYSWLIQQAIFRERVYVIGAGERANRLIASIRTRTDLGMEVIGWTGAMGNGSLTRESLADKLRQLPTSGIDRVIVAMSDRRGTMPVRELLDVRLRGIPVEESSSLMEKISGKIEVDDLHPSSLLFAEGFRLNTGMMFVRRLVSILVSLVGLIICLPLIPLVALAVRLSSPGPVLFRQERVGRKGEIFTLYKFRTMRQDAELHTGAVWAEKDDPRVTLVGRFLRTSRLDEIPQLWSVLKGDMGFVGPRPERPEFVQWLAESIPYYHLRHIIRPGITGWAQVRYEYGASLEQAKEKLQYDLYYVKHMSVALDLWIMFETVKTVLLRRGAQ